MKYSVLILPFVSALLFSCSVSSPVSLLQSDQPGVQQSWGEIGLSLRTDKPRYKEGEAVKIYLTADSSCEVEIYSEDAEGERTWIKSQSGTGKWKLSSGRTLTFPPPNAGWNIKAAKPYGTCILVAKAVKYTTPSQHGAEQQLLQGEAKWLYEVNEK